MRPPEGAPTLTIREVASQKQYTILNGATAHFSHDSQFVAYLINPDPDLLDKLREDEDFKGELPLPKLEILDLINDRSVTLPDVRAISLPEEAAHWIAYSPAKSVTDVSANSGVSEIAETYTIESSGLTKSIPNETASTPSPAVASAGEHEQEALEGGKEAEPTAKKSQEEGQKAKGKEKEKENGEVLVLRSLASGIERRFPDVTSHAFSKYGARLAFAASATDATADGVFVLDLATGKLEQVISGRGAYHS
ncbi:MAG: hypothetical protein O3A20_09800, partial [Planctomycetota bacterium]|nr:hypothetical protein [Planctomycetota bacterium]